jgi:hypothetical protein
VLSASSRGLTLCAVHAAQENSFLLGLGVAVTAVALTCAAMLWAAQSHLRAQSSKAASGMPLPDVRAGVPQSVRQASCYINSGQQPLQELLQRTRPGAAAGQARVGGDDAGPGSAGEGQTSASRRGCTHPG